MYFGRKRYILYAFFSFCRLPVYFLRLQRSLCHQPWDLRPRGCLVGSEGRAEAGMWFIVIPMSSSEGPPVLESVLGTRRSKKAIYGGLFVLELTG
jgi:hypothetical protein|uniref:Uncharacterized protein n=1 Tax=Castor canadensis TaxID=51338 RepID=A0A8C0WH37_CASCN